MTVFNPPHFPLASNEPLSYSKSKKVLRVLVQLPVQRQDELSLCPSQQAFAYWVSSEPTKQEILQSTWTKAPVFLRHSR